MKRIYCIFCITLFIIGCTSREVEIPVVVVKESLSVSRTSFSVQASSSGQSFTIYSNTNWLVESDQPWCKVQPLSGKDTATLNFNVEANTSKQEARSATITVRTSSGKLFQKISVAQVAEKAEEFAFSISTNSVTIPPAGGDASFNITTGTRWEISCDYDWCSFSPRAGEGNSRINIKVYANPSTSNRTATLTIKSGNETKTLAINQSGSNATLSISATEFSVEAKANNRIVSITSNSNWQVSSNQEWCTVYPTSGSGNTTIVFRSTENTALAARTAIISITTGGEERTITVNQAAADESLSVSETAFIVPSEASTKTLSIQSNVSWNVESDEPSWCSVSPASGSNDGIVTINIEKNISFENRTATITVSAGEAKRTILVEQAPANESLFVSSSKIFIYPSGDIYSFVVSCDKEWSVSCNQGWCFVEQSTTSGYGIVTMTIEQNKENTERMAEITVVAGIEKKTVILTQGPANDYLRLSQNKFEISSENQTCTLNIESNTDWSVNLTPDDWCYASSTKGFGDGMVVFTIDKNDFAKARSATISISTNDNLINVPIQQAAAAEIFYVEQNTFNVPSPQIQLPIRVFSNTEWHVEGNVDNDWCSLSSRVGTGNKVIDVSITQNESSFPREINFDIVSLQGTKITINIKQEEEKK